MQQCKDCNSELPDHAIVCPVCAALVYRAELQESIAKAAAFSDAGDFVAARDTWRAALRYLPEGSKQSRIIGENIEALNKKIPASANASPKQDTQGSAGKKVGIFVAAGLFLWKFKIIFAFILTKGKLLLLGFTKASTFLSLILSLGVYWSVFGWQLAVGVLIGLYLHEMGHVLALKHYGIPASAPMFIPGFGAYVRLHEHPANAVENARVGLAGPSFGLAVALICYAIFSASGTPILAALARITAWINLFNLLPFWQLDGNRGLMALTRRERILLVVVMVGTFVVTHEGLLLILALVAGFRAFAADHAEKTDGFTLYQFAGLIVALGFLTSIEVPLMAPGKP